MHNEKETTQQRERRSPKSESGQQSLLIDLTSQIRDVKGYVANKADTLAASIGLSVTFRVQRAKDDGTLSENTTTEYESALAGVDAKGQAVYVLLRDGKALTALPEGVKFTIQDKPVKIATMAEMKDFVVEYHLNDMCETVRLKLAHMYEPILDNIVGYVEKWNSPGKYK